MNLASEYPVSKMVEVIGSVGCDRRCSYLSGEGGGRKTKRMESNHVEFSTGWHEGDDGEAMENDQIFALLKSVKDMRGIKFLQ